MAAVTQVGLSGLSSILKKRYSRRFNNKVTVVDLPLQYQLDTIIQLLKILTTQQEGVYISTLKVYSELVKILEDSGVDTTKLHFVDVITKMYGLEPAETGQCVFVSSPVNIQSINSAVVSQLAGLNGTPFVILDSLTTILLYNSVPRIVEFTKKMAEYIRRDVNGLLVMMSTAKGTANQKLISELGPIIDDIIQIKV